MYAGKNIKGRETKDRMTLTDQIFLLFLTFWFVVQGDKKCWDFEKNEIKKTPAKRDSFSPLFYPSSSSFYKKKKKKWNKITCKRGGFLDLPGFPPSPSCVGAAIFFFIFWSSTTQSFFFFFPSQSCPIIYTPISLPHNNNNNPKEKSKEESFLLLRFKVRFKQTHFFDFLQSQQPHRNLPSPVVVVVGDPWSSSVWHVDLFDKKTRKRIEFFKVEKHKIWTRLFLGCAGCHTSNNFVGQTFFSYSSSV